MQFVVGLTGGICSGKTTVASLFAELGASIIDTDIIARKIVQPGMPALKQIADHFGHQIISNDQLDRRQLKQIVFSNKAERQWLEQLLHPLIRQEMLAQIQQSQANYSIAVIPLLIETQNFTHIDRVLVVDIPQNLQKQRLSERDEMDNQMIEKILSSQTDRNHRLQHADDVIDNSVDLAELKPVVLKLHQHYLKLAKKNESH